MALSCIACSIFHIISIPFNCSDTAIRVAKAVIGTKVITLCLVKFALFLEFRARTRSRSSAFCHLGNRAEISYMNPRRNKIGPGNPASSVNWVHVKRPFIFF